MELLDEVTDWNWSLRDVLKQWKVLLSDTLTAGYVDKGLLDMNLSEAPSPRPSAG